MVAKECTMAHAHSTASRVLGPEDQHPRFPAAAQGAEWRPLTPRQPHVQHFHMPGRQLPLLQTPAGPMQARLQRVARQQMDDATLKRQGKGRGCLNLKTCKLRKSSSNQQVWYQGLRYSDCKRAHTALQPWSPDLKNNVPAFQQPHKGRDGAR